MTSPPASGTSPSRPDAPPTATAGVRHRADIQGLRAIAVLAVIAVHVGLSSVTGGFVGVDVFFAISGFLITQQLIRSFERVGPDGEPGKVSLLAFYARRARRILPAATLVLLVTVAYAALRLGFVRTREIVADATWSAFFAANIRFSSQETDYFAADLPPSPLQHFWSLAVEEQFYLVWPVVVMVGVLVHRFRMRHGHGRPGGVRRGLTIAVALLTVASLLASAVITKTDPAGAYFSPLTRAWELGLGALAALAIRENGPQDSTARWRAQTLGAAGVFLILSACLQFNDATPFPGTPALVPVLGSVFILVAGSLWHGPTVVSRLLSVPPLRVLGNWSYSLYLWHFPLLVLPEIDAGRDLGWGEKTLLVLLAVLLSGLSYHFVEEPFRRGRRALPSWRVVTLYPVSVALVVAVGAGGNAWSTYQYEHAEYQPAITVAGADTEPDTGPEEGTEAPGDRASASPGAGATDTTPAEPAEPEVPDGPSLALVKASIQAARDDRGIPSDLEPALDELQDDTADVGACDYLNGSRRLCPRGDADGDRTLVVLGDSHGRHWIPAMEQIAAATGYKAYYLVRPQCMASMVTPDVLFGESPDHDCARWHDWANDQVERLQPDLLVIATSTGRGEVHEGGTRYSGEEADRRVYAGYLELLDEVLPAAERTVWLRDVPTLDEDPGTCLSSNTSLGPCLFSPDATHADQVDQQVRAARSRDVPVVDLDRYFCARGDCAPVVGSVTTYRDKQHITTDYAAWLAGPLGTALGLW